MYLRCTEPDTELRRRSRLFARLSDDEQTRLLRLVIHNDLHGRASPPTSATTHIADPSPAGNLDQLVSHVEAVTQLPAGWLTELATDVQRSDDHRPSTWLSAWADVLGSIAGECAEAGSVSAAFGACFALAGHVPCPAYAFGRWHVRPGLVADATVVRDLVELACAYAYRLIPVRQSSPPGALVGRGAYSVSTRQGHVLTKTAINLAAHDFMLEQEANLLDLAECHPMSERLPQLHGWDPTTGRLRRAYVPGSTGHDLLLSGGFPTQRVVEDLQRAHTVLVDGLRYLRVRLDLHPGNFVWHTDQQSWVLVDAGPVPSIGADYYDLDSFDDYLRRVWLQRLDNMRRAPIRSLEWEPLLPLSVDAQRQSDRLPLPPLED